MNTKSTKFMRGYAYLIAITLPFLFFTSCSKIDDSTELNIIISPPNTAYTIPIITSLDTGFTIATIPLRLNLDSMIKDQNKRFSAADIKTIKLNSFRLNITDVDTAITFANFQTIGITLEGSGAPSSVLASLNVTDSKVKVLTIPITATDNDLKPLPSVGLVSFKIKGKLRRATTKPYAITATTTFRVKLGL